MENWIKTTLGDVLNYEQPTKYIVESVDYDNNFETPVLTAGKSFVLGYTNEKKGIYNKVPVIIFDDFTTAFHYVDFPFKVKSSAMKILKADEEKADLRFLYYRMSKISLDTQLHKRYWISKFAKTQIPLPPLEIQKKIAQILDDAAELKNKTEQLIKEYDELEKSIFLDLFGDTWTNPKDWKEYFVEDLAKKEKHAIKAGPFGSSLKKEFYVDEGYKIYGQEQVIYDDFIYGDYFINEELYQKLKSCKISSGDILISLVGTYGKISIVPEIFQKGIINPRLMKISPDLNIVRSDVLKKILQSNGVKIQLKNKSRGQTMGVLNLGIIKKIKIPVPPLELQNQFAEKITLIEKQKELAKQELKESEDLFNCLLQKAFKGELG